MKSSDKVSEGKVQNGDDEAAPGADGKLSMTVHLWRVSPHRPAPPERLAAMKRFLARSDVNGA